MAATARSLMLAVLVASFWGSMAQIGFPGTGTQPGTACSCPSDCTGFPTIDATVCVTVASYTTFSVDVIGGTVGAPPASVCVKVDDTVVIVAVTGGYVRATVGSEVTTTCGHTNGDPVVTGFNGAQFEFAGVAGQAYSFLSTPDHSLNVAMVPANLSQKEAGGTFIGSASLMFRGHTVQASADEHGNLTVSVDNTVITTETLANAPNHAAEFAIEDDSSVTVQLFHANFGHSVRMETPLMIATLFATPPGLDEYYAEYVRGYLNLAIQLKPSADLSQMHGVLGQTVHAKDINAAGVNAAALNTITAFSGKGEEADYLVSSLTASDSKFNTFGKAPVKLTIARRMLNNGDATVPLGIATVAPPMLVDTAVRNMK